MNERLVTKMNERLVTKMNERLVTKMNERLVTKMNERHVILHRLNTTLTHNSGLSSTLSLQPSPNNPLATVQNV
jgi:hypothetical protein